MRKSCISAHPFLHELCLGYGINNMSKWDNIDMTDVIDSQQSLVDAVEQNGTVFLSIANMFGFSAK